MTMPKAYQPEQGYKYQILTRNLQYSREWDHCDYAKDKEEKNYLMQEYKLAYGSGWSFKSILLPQKYHK